MRPSHYVDGDQFLLDRELEQDFRQRLTTLDTPCFSLFSHIPRVRQTQTRGNLTPPRARRANTTPSLALVVGCLGDRETVSAETVLKKRLSGGTGAIPSQIAEPTSNLNLPQVEPLGPSVPGFAPQLNHRSVKAQRFARPPLARLEPRRGRLD